MKIVLAFAIAVILLTVMTPIALATDSSGSGTTVYVSVSVDGKLLVAAQPVTITDMTVEDVIKAAHAEFYSGGENGYTAGIDPTWGMYLITQCWGIQATPFVIVNDAPLGSDPTVPATVDAAPVVANDNIIICTSSDMMNNPAQPVSLTATLSGDAATVTATAWTLDFMTFMYSSAPLANANVIDPATGASLGTTDADGRITVTVPESGVVAIEGLAAINVKAAPVPAPPAPTSTSAAPAPAPAAPSGSGTTVYVSVSVDGELLVAAQPVTITDMTVEAVIKATHAEFYSGGENGYTAGIDPTWGMFLITQCWGIQATPYVIINDAPLGSDPTVPATVDAAPVIANDNIIICTSSDMMNNPAQPVSLTATLSGDAATVTATAWTLDFMTFMYSSAPLADANVIDPATGASLGTTDADGRITVTVPESGVVAIEGLAAINVKVTPAPAPPAPTSAAPASQPAAPAATDTPLLYGPTISLIIAMVIILTPILVIIVVKMVRQSRLDKVNVQAAAAVSPSAALSSIPAGPAPASAPPISTPAPPAPTSTSVAPAPAPAAPSGSEVTVYVSVSVDGKLLVAAQPVTITDMTVQGAIKAAHAEYYSGGESGYTAGIDPTFNMFLINRCWGIQATPYVIVNDKPLGADPNVPPTVDAAPVVANDNIIICTSSDPMNKPAQPVSLTATLSGDAATMSATAWTLDFTTFTYSSAPLAKAKVVDPVTGASLGTTDAKGRITVTVPESGVVAIDGLAAIAAASKKRKSKGKNV